MTVHKDLSLRTADWSPHRARGVHRSAMRDGPVSRPCVRRVERPVERASRAVRVFAASLLCFAFFLPACAAAQSSGDDVPRPVKTEVIGGGSGEMTRQFFGTVSARQTVDLGFQVSGQLQHFPVVEGETIVKGTLIAALDLVPFQLALDRARAEQAQAQRALGRLEQLSANSRSEAALEDAGTAAELAAIAVRDAERALEQATLAAPFDALVAARNVANFTTVQAGTPVVRLHDVSEWRVEIEVPEQLFRQVDGAGGGTENIGLHLRFPGDDRTIPLVPREFNAEAGAIGQTFSITLAMTEAPGPGVLPGTAATVVARLPLPEAPIALPPSAVVIAPDGTTSVMVFEPAGADGPSGTVAAVEVTIESGPSGEYILRDGLEPGTEIVVAGAAMLRDGQAVRRFTGFPN